MQTENFCNKCDTVINGEVDDKDFKDHKVGKIICPNCGSEVMPCNECDEVFLNDGNNHTEECDNCPWRDSKEQNIILLEKENNEGFKIKDLLYEIIEVNCKFSDFKFITRSYMTSVNGVENKVGYIRIEKVLDTIIINFAYDKYTFELVRNYIDSCK